MCVTCLGELLCGVAFSVGVKPIGDDFPLDGDGG